MRTRLRPTSWNGHYRITAGTPGLSSRLTPKSLMEAQREPHDRGSEQPLLAVSAGRRCNRLKRGEDAGCVKSKVGVRHCRELVRTATNVAACLLSIEAKRVQAPLAVEAHGTSGF